MASPISEEQLIPVIRSILEGKDLSTMTLKIVRESILKTLEKPPVDIPKFKQNVKAALNFVLQEAQRADAEQTKNSPAAQGNKLTEKLGNPKQQKSQPANSVNVIDPKTDGALSDPVASKGNGKKKSSKKEVNGGLKHDESDDNDESNDDHDYDDFLVVPSKKSNSNKSQKKKRRSSSDDSHNGDNLKRPRTVDKSAKENDQDEPELDDVFDDESYGEETKTSKPRKTKKEKGSPKPSRKKRERTRTPASSGNKEYDKLNAVLRAVGLRLPPSKFKGKKTMEGKCEAIREFLKSKSINNLNPTTLSRKELEEHRERIEREKDMIDIDVSNIIQEGRRTRRRAAPLNITVQPDGDESPPEKKETGPPADDVNNDEDEDEDEDVYEAPLSDESD